MPNEPFFRIDKFMVPTASRDRFTDQLKQTHDALDALTGCEENMIFEQSEGPGQFNIVTFVKWRDRACYEEARKAAQEHQALSGFDPAAFMADLGVVPDLGNYTCLA